MASNAKIRATLEDAITAIEQDDWHRAHRLVQPLATNETANWLHALLHKIEGDAGNAGYWYQHSPAAYHDFKDKHAELNAIRAHFDNTHADPKTLTPNIE